MPSDDLDTTAARISRIEYLEQALADFERMAKTFEDAGKATAAVQAKSKAVATRGELDQMRELQDEDGPDDGDDHLLAHLIRMQRYRRGAARSGSWVAVRDFSRQELEVRTKIDEREERRRKQRLEDYDEEQILELVLDMARGLPDGLLSQLREALEQVA